MTLAYYLAACVVDVYVENDIHTALPPLPLPLRRIISAFLFLFFVFCRRARDVVYVVRCWCSYFFSRPFVRDPQERSHIMYTIQCTCEWRWWLTVVFYVVVVVVADANTIHCRRRWSIHYVLVFFLTVHSFSGWLSAYKPHTYRTYVEFLARTSTLFSCVSRAYCCSTHISWTTHNMVSVCACGGMQGLVEKRANVSFRGRCRRRRTCIYANCNVTILLFVWLRCVCERNENPWIITITIIIIQNMRKHRRKTPNAKYLDVFNASADTQWCWTWARMWMPLSILCVPVMVWCVYGYCPTLHRSVVVGNLLLFYQFSISISSRQ